MSVPVDKVEKKVSEDARGGRGRGGRGRGRIGPSRHQDSGTYDRRLFEIGEELNKEHTLKEFIQTELDKSNRENAALRTQLAAALSKLGTIKLPTSSVEEFTEAVGTAENVAVLQQQLHDAQTAVAADHADALLARAKQAADAAMAAFRLAHAGADAATIQAELLRVAAQHTDVNAGAIAPAVEAIYAQLLHEADALAQEHEARLAAQALALQTQNRQAADAAMAAFRLAHAGADAATIHAEGVRLAAQHRDINGVALVHAAEIIYAQLLNDAEALAQAQSAQRVAEARITALIPTGTKDTAWQQAFYTCKSTGINLHGMEDYMNPAHRQALVAECGTMATLCMLHDEASGGNLKGYVCSPSSLL
jgi:hypothetical protein